VSLRPLSPPKAVAFLIMRLLIGHPPASELLFKSHSR
jgi:hypothetical protein